MMKDKMVSVFFITYNQETYIKDALEGFLMQKTNFAYEVVVYDDASTDGTKDILLEYQSKYPEIFRLYLSDKNRWRDKDRKRFMLDFQRNNLHAKYIACCEGDDYWTDENKLQIQVDYMEAHPECSMYIHNCQWLDCTTGQFRAGNPISIDGEGDVAVEELILQKNGHPPTASFLFRKELFDAPDFFYKAPVGDYTQLLCAAAHGKVHYNSKMMSVYRWKAKGSFTSQYGEDLELRNYNYLGLLQFLKKYNEYTEKKWQDVIGAKSIPWMPLVLEFCRKTGTTVYEYYRRCEEKGYYLDWEDDTLLDEMNRIINRETVTFLSEDVKNFAAKHSKIVIMGAGEYSQILTERLNYHGISFEGYAVSKYKDACREFNGKKLWELDKMPFDKNELGVIVGILITDKEDIQNSLNRAGILEYCMPFEYKLFE